MSNEANTCREYVEPKLEAAGWGRRADSPPFYTEQYYFTDAGAVVLSQVKGWEGAISVCSSELAGRYVSPEYRTFSCVLGQAIPEYLAALVATPWFWTQLKDLTRGMGGRRERTRPEQFLRLEIPMPTIDQQKKAIPIFQKVDAMKLLREGALKELDAMLPSILDKAFKG